MMALRPCVHSFSRRHTQVIKSNNLSITTFAVLNIAAQQEQKRSHKYSQRWQFKDVESTTKHLLQQVVYHKDGVLAINKPPDLGSSKAESSIYHSLPSLAKEFGYKYLKLVSVPEKSVSGVTILAAEVSIADHIQKALRRSKSVYTHDPRQKFVAVTVGHPILENGYEKVGISLQHKGKEKYPIISRQWSANAVKRREVNVGTVGYRTLAKSPEASLVSVSTWQLRHHCPRVFLSDVLLSPALGDQQFGSRASSLFGKPILLKPWAAPVVKALPLPLLEKLHVRSGSEQLVPLHFHLHEVTLSDFLPGKKDLVLRAEPPDYFKWTCEQLALEWPTDQEPHEIPSTCNETPDIKTSHYPNYESIIH